MGVESLGFRVQGWGFVRVGPLARVRPNVHLFAGVEFGGWGLGFGVWGLVLGNYVWGWGLGVWGLRLRVWGLGFMMNESWSMVHELEFRIWG